MMTILGALADQNLFQPHFKGDSWNAWRAFLGALFALPLSEADLAVYRQCTGHSAPPRAPFNEAALVVGRRGGKSRVLALIAVFLGCFKDYRPHLASGEKATIAVLAAKRDQARSIFGFINGLLSETPLLAAMVVDATEERIVLNNRVVIEIATASFRTSRGYSFAAVLADEIAFWHSDESSANPDVEIVRALRPGMSTIPGSILLMASSPYAKRGELYNAYRRHYGKDESRVLVWKADTATMNPRVDPAVISEAYESDPESARAEYGAEFRTDLADFVAREAVDAVTMLGRRELPPEPGVQYQAFCDPSGGISDAMTLAVAHLAGNTCILDAVHEVRPPFDPEVAVAECAALLKRFDVARVIGDKYAGEWPRARFREHGISFEQSVRPKSDLYGDLLPLINGRRIELLDHPRLAAQLVGLERKTARSGKDSIDHTPGGHDDLANAVAGVLVGLDLDRRPSLVRSGAMLVDGAPVVPHPRGCFDIFASMASDKHGKIATAYFALNVDRSPPLMLLDFDVAYLDGKTFRAVASRVDELGKTVKGHRRLAVTLLAVEELADIVRGAVQEIGVGLLPFVAGDYQRLSITAAHHVSNGGFKISGLAHEKAQGEIFHAAMDFTSGVAFEENALRAALLYGISGTFGVN
jgi:hypothetical protein